MSELSFPPGPFLVATFFRGLKRRILATAALLVGGLCWLILYLAFLAGHFAWYQNLAIVLVLVIVIPAVVVLMWVSWAMGLGRRMGRAFWDDHFS